MKLSMKPCSMDEHVQSSHSFKIGDGKIMKRYEKSMKEHENVKDGKSKLWQVQVPF